MFILSDGSNKPSVVNLAAKYYNFGRSGTDRLMLLDCRGYMKDTQTDCITYLPNGMLTHANRYDIRRASFHLNNYHNFTPQEMFRVFLQIINGATRYNSNGKMNPIPLIFAEVQVMVRALRKRYIMTGEEMNLQIYNTQ